MYVRLYYCSKIVLYSMNMFYTLYSIYTMYIQFILIFTNFKNEDKYLNIVHSSSSRYKVVGPTTLAETFNGSLTPLKSADGYV